MALNILKLAAWIYIFEFVSFAVAERPINMTDFKLDNVFRCLHPKSDRFVATGTLARAHVAENAYPNENLLVVYINRTWLQWTELPGCQIKLNECRTPPRKTSCYCKSRTDTLYNIVIDYTYEHWLSMAEIRLYWNTDEVGYGDVLSSPIHLPKTCKLRPQALTSLSLTAGPMPQSLLAGDGNRKTECSNCLGEKCDKKTKICSSSGCIPGFLGETCEQACQPFFYGPKCSKNCSDNCAGEGMCDNEDGSCMDGCREGYQLPMCETKCPEMKYGKDCELECSKHCGGNGSCDSVTGKCVSGCHGGYEGDSCGSVEDDDDSGSQIWDYMLVTVGVLLAFTIASRSFYRSILQGREDRRISELECSQKRDILPEIDLPEHSPEQADNSGMPELEMRPTYEKFPLESSVD